MTSNFMTYQEKRRLVGKAEYQYLDCTITSDFGYLTKGETYPEIYIDYELGTLEAYIEDCDNPVVEIELVVAVSE